MLSFVSLNESLDLTTPSGKALAGMLAVFAEFERSILKERVKAGIVEARSKGKAHGRPKTASNQKEAVIKLFARACYELIGMISSGYESKSISE